MIKILHMSTALDGGGVEKFLLNYYKHINRKKIHFSIIVPGFKKGLLEDDFLQLGANVYHVHKLSDNLFKGIIDIYKVVKNNEYDVVHCHGNKSSLLGIIFGFFCGIKVRIVHAHMTEETIVHFKKIYKKISSLIIDLFCRMKTEGGVWILSLKSWRKSKRRPRPSWSMRKLRSMR